MIKIAFFDIDGTLKVTGKEGISPNTLYMLRSLQERGIKIVIATGRSPITLPHFAGVEFDAWLTFNGSYCFDKETTIFSQPIPHRDALQIVENAQGLKRPVVLATKDALIANGTDADMIEYFALASLEVEVSSRFNQLLEEDIYQIMLGSRAEEYDALMKGAEGAKITTWWHRGVDIIPASTGKGVGVKRMLEYYGYTQEEAISFGDGGNDLELLEATGTSVAVANACPELKAIADEVCGSVEADGVYYYCVRKGLISPKQ